MSDSTRIDSSAGWTVEFYGVIKSPGGFMFEFDIHECRLTRHK